MVIIFVVTADDIAQAHQAVFARVTGDQPALQRGVEGRGLDLRRGELPVFGRTAIHAFNMQVIELVEGEFEGVQAIDFHHSAVFEGIEQGVGWGSHGNQSLNGKAPMIAHSAPTQGGSAPAIMRDTYSHWTAPFPMDYRKPSDRKSMHSRIVQELGMQIVSGRFLPDDKLPAEALLCEEYAVSRPVLREATRVLVAKGLVYSRPRVGTVVKPRKDWHMLDPDVLHWLMQSSPQSQFFDLLTSVRSIIEPAAAALAAQFATEADIASIGEAYQRMEAAPTPEALLQPDLDFHSRIADATHNDLLANLCNMLSVAIAEALKHSNQRPNLHERALPRHKAILTAIENRDALGARHATLVQLDDARSALNVVLGSDPS